MKRVQHDVIIPQAVVQNTYARLKAKYAKILITNWVEVTDPGKHVFEDLSIAAFLIELWKTLYKDAEFPGFVDIGCGNGLLVHILAEEGYSGWGFDARKRKSWTTYSSEMQERLKELVLIPSMLRMTSTDTNNDAGNETEVDHEDIKINMSNSQGDLEHSDSSIHNGLFPQGTFIISNHADELTPWTPILANLSRSPFIAIPCCSHALNGARFRAPPPKGAPSSSAFASLVDWVTSLGKDCGWQMEKEMLRIPSTRNTALIGRHRLVPFEDVEVSTVLANYGGADGWEANAMKLVRGATRGH